MGSWRRQWRASNERPTRPEPPGASATSQRSLGAGVMNSKPNVLFLMVDCLRADTLWDRERYPSMPHLDRLAERASVFTTAIAAATTTTPSVATMLTGLAPAEHGIRSLLGYKLRPGVRTLADELREAGYYTAAETTGPLFPETEL